MKLKGLSEILCSYQCFVAFNVVSALYFPQGQTVLVT